MNYEIVRLPGVLKLFRPNSVGASLAMAEKSLKILKLK